MNLLNREQSLRRPIAYCLFALLLSYLWAMLFPYTGEGDAVMHYLTAKAAWIDPSAALSAFARPLHKLLFVLPAHLGYSWARAFSGLITLALMGQTMALAKDWKIKRPELAMPLLFFQPFIFAMATDIMTEIPAALAILIALRLWIHRRWGASCLLISLVPMLRPEGFYLIVIWLLMLTWKCLRKETPLPRCILFSFSLAIGCASWLLACRIFAHDWIYVLRYWSWPVQSYASYGRGSIFYYVYHWPEYAGMALLPLTLIGVPFFIRKERLLGVVIWASVFGAHAFMFWRGKFASVGLVRILAVGAPYVALVCLEAWNHLADRLSHRSPAQLKRLGWIAMFAIALSAMIQEVLIPTRYNGLCLTPAADYIRDHHLLTNAPHLFMSDRIVLARLDFIPLDENYIPSEKFDRTLQLQTLRNLPVGSVGVWDNQRGLSWHTVSINDLKLLGYDILYENTQLAPNTWKQIFKGQPWISKQKCVVALKVIPPENLPQVQELPENPSP